MPPLAMPMSPSFFSATKSPERSKCKKRSLGLDDSKKLTKNFEEIKPMSPSKNLKKADLRRVYGVSDLRELFGKFIISPPVAEEKEEEGGVLTIDDDIPNF